MSTHRQSFYFNIDDKLRLKFHRMNFTFAVFDVQPADNAAQLVSASAKGFGALRFRWDPTRPSQHVRIGRYDYWIVYEGRSIYANAT